VYNSAPKTCSEIKSFFHFSAATIIPFLTSVFV
jgi:hypothetical protein